MPRAPHTVVAGHYFMAVAGLALVRDCLRDPDAIAPRVDELVHIASHLTDFPNSLEIPMIEHDFDEGYSLWAKTYDGPNPAIEREQPIVHAMLESLEAGSALDAACGTGRHAAQLAALGHRVMGVDANEAMLAVARDKVPSGHFQQGQLEDLPVDDATVDVLTCSLALTHVADLRSATRELARVMKPGATAVLSDIHPFNTVLGGGIAGFPGAELPDGVPFVLNLEHKVSDYIAAFADAGLVIEECVEPLFSDAEISRLPSYSVYPDACHQAFGGIPFLLIWRLTRAA